MITVGLSHDLWMSSAALCENGIIKFAIAEERLNRLKKFKGYPRLAVAECLKLAGADLKDVDLFINGWNPARHMKSLHTRYSSSARWRPEYLFSIPNYLIHDYEDFDTDVIDQSFGPSNLKIKYIDHHLAHASSAYYLSPYDKAAIMVSDGRGENDTISFWIGEGTEIRKIPYCTTYPHSLGLLYGTFTQFLGFEPDSDEWKVMALGAYAKGKNKYIKKIKELINVDEEYGSVRLNLSCLGYHQPDVFMGLYYTDDLKKMFGEPRRKNEELTDKHKEIAYAMQFVYEETSNKLLEFLYKKTKIDNLVMAGGCIMNSLHNGKIIGNTSYKNLFIPSCPDDSGISVGSALYGYYSNKNNKREYQASHNYWGPSFEDEYESELQKYKIRYERVDNPSEKAAQLLAEGKLLGWFQGSMEFGQRSLGNRSILADPRNQKSKELVNSAVKYREQFRPFAPSILSEHANEYFEIKGDQKVPFMERVFFFKKSKKNIVPAVVHADGSGRLQTVDKETNEPYYALINEFYKLTGVPIVLNTSFNLNGEPIVCSVKDAIRTFYSCGLDGLFIGKCFIHK